MKSISPIIKKALCLTIITALVINIFCNNNSFLYYISKPTFDETELASPEKLKHILVASLDASSISSSIDFIYEDLRIYLITDTAGRQFGTVFMRTPYSSSKYFLFEQFSITKYPFRLGVKSRDNLLSLEFTESYINLWYKGNLVASRELN